MKTQQAVGRLAYRVEGDTWNCYYATPDTMDGALLLGSIRMNLVMEERRKEQFMQLMQSFFADFMAEISGSAAEFPDPAHSAPEHERAGRA